MYPRMFGASGFLRRPCLASVLPPRNLQRLLRNTTFASRRLSPVPYTKSLVLSRLLSTKAPSPSAEPKTMSTHAHAHFEEGNSPYVAGFKDKGKLAIPPAKHLAIGWLIYGSRRDVEPALRLIWSSSDLHGCTYRVSVKDRS